jgi:hypothetical protein
MKTNTILTKVLLGLSILFGLTLVLDFISLHDIQNDYVSRSVINQFSSDSVKFLPDWSSTSGEWLLVKVSFLLKTIAFLAFLLVVSIQKKRIALKP